MKKLTLRQEEYLMLFAMRDGHDRCIAEAAEQFQVSKPSASNVAKVLEEQGMIEKNTYGEIRLTGRGWDYISGKVELMRILARWLEMDLGLTPAKAESEARKLAATLEEETAKAMISHLESRKTAAGPSGPIQVLEALAPGLYQTEFEVRRKDSPVLSMGDQGFLKPAILVKKEKDSFFLLRPRRIRYMQPNHKSQQGTLDRLWYRLGRAWYETQKMADDSYLLPFSALLCQKSDGGLTGFVRVRARASVGLRGMPESEADMVFFLKEAQPFSQGLADRQARK